MKDIICKIKHCNKIADKHGLCYICNLAEIKSTRDKKKAEERKKAIREKIVEGLKQCQ